MEKKGKKRALGRGLSALVSSPVPIRPASKKAGESLAEKEIAGKKIGESSEGVASFEGSAARKIDAVTDVAPAEEAGSTSGVQYIPISKIENNPDQPRQVFKDEELQTLADSIREHGLLQPVLVRKSSDKDAYEIIAGERRWRACKRLGLNDVPAIIQDVDNREALEIAIVENVQRSNLNPIEEAEAYQRLIDEFSLTQQEVGEKVGKDRASISNYLRLLQLPKAVRDLLNQEKISMGHAKAILTIKEPSVQESLGEKVVKEGLSVRALEAIVSREVKINPGKIKERKSKADAQSAGGGQFPLVVNRLRGRLGTKVSIKHHPSGRGKIEIEYFSEQELDRLADLIDS